VRYHPVKPDPLEHGGDGLVIYQNASGVLVFRLWEIKKHQPERPTRLSRTIRDIAHFGAGVVPCR
jgi:hypothetical protein